MIKVLKYLTAFVAIVTIATGVYFYFSFTNIHFLIKNELDQPITASITLHSTASSKDYTYPLLGNAAVSKGSSIESFYTIDKATEGTRCIGVEFRDREEKLIKKFSCPKEGETLVIK